MSQLNLLTTKKCKTGKLKSKKWICSEVTVKVCSIHVVSPGEEKERLWCEGFAEKEGFKPGMQESVDDGKLIIISIRLLAA